MEQHGIMADCRWPVSGCGSNLRHGWRRGGGGPWAR